MKYFLIKIILLLPLEINHYQVESFLASNGIKARVKVVSVSKSFLALGSERKYFFELKSAFKEDKYKYVHVLTEPFRPISTDASGNIEIGANEYIVGLGSTSSKFSFSVWNTENNLGQNRVLHSWQAMLHELGHNLLHLNHDGVNKCKTIMDANVLACPNLAELTFSKQQLKNIK